MNDNILDGIPSRPQRQDSTISQVQDLIRVAARLGMYDAADSIKQVLELGKFDDIQYGCHCDLEEHMEPDSCVLIDGHIHDCFYARDGMRPEQCEYWRPIPSKENYFK